MPKIEKYIFTNNICSAHNLMQVVDFSKMYFLEQRLKFSHFEGSIIR